MNLSTAINARMHEGRCPTAGSLGECPAIWVERHATNSDALFCSAAIYLWSAGQGLKMAEIASWFEAEGCTDVIVFATMHDPDNETLEGVCSDGARPLHINFLLDIKRAAELGLAVEPGSQVGAGFA